MSSSAVRPGHDPDRIVRDLAVLSSDTDAPDDDLELALEGAELHAEHQITD